MADEVSVDQLLRLLEHEQPVVKRATCLALGQRRERKAAVAIARLLRDGVWQVREAAAQALGEIGHEGAIETLTHRLNHGGNLRQTVLNTLAARPGAKPEQSEPAGGTVMGGGRAGETEDHPQVLQAICLALARLSPAIAHEPLLALLRASQPQQVIAAAIGLGQHMR